MYDGFIKVGAASPEIRVADTEYNAAQIIKAIKAAAEAGVKLLVLPELCVTGYTCGDIFMQPTLIAGAGRAVEQIAGETAGLEIISIVGAPAQVNGALYDCAAIIYRGNVLALIPKAAPSDGGGFSERRWFAPAPEKSGEARFMGRSVAFGADIVLRCGALPEFSFGVDIGGDLNTPGENARKIAAGGANIICVPTASNEMVGRAESRRLFARANTSSLAAGLICAGAGTGESTTDFVFAGHCLIAENGRIIAEAAPFSGKAAISEIDAARIAHERRRRHFDNAAPDINTVEFDMAIAETELTRRISPAPFIPDDKGELAARCEAILEMQCRGLAKRMSHAHARTAVIGISGGLDSTLALLVAARAMDAMGRPRSDVIAVTMPCFGTTARTKSNAEKLSERIGATLMRVDISAAVRQHFADIGQDESNTDVTFENAQARERTQVIMDIANQRGGLVVGTGDLSELALGWATYNGDHMSMYGVNASVPKTLIRHIVRHCAGISDDGELSATLMDILATPVSPELLPAKDGSIAQVTEDLVGPYELHDFFLYYALRWACPPKKILRMAKYAFAGAYDDATVQKWLKTFYRRFFAQQFKRSCLPDGPKVGSVGLSPRGDLVMPSDASAALWMSEI